jgi:hypothetical protein
LGAVPLLYIMDNLEGHFLHQDGKVWESKNPGVILRGEVATPSEYIKSDWKGDG